MEIKRQFTEAGKDPFSYFEYERGPVYLRNELILADAEFPKHWSEHARGIFADKYFRKKGVPQPDGALGGETSVKQTITRIVKAWHLHGQKEGYFTTYEDSVAFYDEMVYMMVGQYASPNSPQYFNTGLYEAYGIERSAPGYYADASGVHETTTRPQTSACFIVSVDDDLIGYNGIYDLLKTEAQIFKFGSGSGTNFSNIRAKGEPLSGGGQSSGVKAFLEVLDTSAGAIKSGGTTRRAAKMIVFDADHPDILSIIKWKRDEEKKARALSAAGYDGGFEGEAINSVSGQNANISIRLSDEFFKELDAELATGTPSWRLKNRTDSEATKIVSAVEIFDAIVECAHESAEPGLHFAGTINAHNTCPNDGEIRASNPCVTGDTLICTDEGNIPIKDLVGKTANIYGLDGKLYHVDKIFETGVKEVIEIVLSDETTLKLTPDHLIYTENRGDVPAGELTINDVLRCLPMDKKSRDSILKIGTFLVGGIEQINTLPPEPVYDLTEPNTNHFFANGIAVHNCSEYLFLDDTACNLASLNLLKFLYPKGGNIFFNDVTYRHAVRLFTITLDISVGMSCFPTKKIAQGSYDYRTLGLGYTNLGACFMAMAIPYDSELAVKKCEAFTKLMYRTALETSIELGKELGSFPRFEANKAQCKAVISAKAPDIEVTHLRNAQLTLLAPTGTISFIMDSDTTGIEPHFELTMTKNLAGGGTMKIESKMVRPALEKLGYGETEIRDILDYLIGHKYLPVFWEDEDLPQFNLGKIRREIKNSFNIEGAIKLAHPEYFLEPEKSFGDLGLTDEKLAEINRYVYGHKTIIGAPHLKPEHYTVFQCANCDQPLSTDAHLNMMAAAQKYLCGAISKTVNLPQTATREDVKSVYLKAYKMGIKCISVYVDNSKMTQPLQSNVKPKTELTESAQVNYSPLVAAQPTETGLLWGQRKPFAKKRNGVTETVKIGGAKVHFTINTFENGAPCELFIEMKASDTFMAMLNMLAKFVSHGLQYGVPIEKIASDLCCFEFAPNGFTDDAEIRTAKSIFDYIGKVLLRDYSGKPKPQSGAAPALYNALSKHLLPCIREHGGGKLCEFVPNGKCLICENCGETTGCS